MTRLRVIEGGKSPPGGGGPDDPTLVYRVAHLEDDIREMKQDIRDIKKVLTDVQVALGEIRGELRRIPTMAQAWAMTVTTWIAGAGIVLLALRLIQQ